MMPGQKYDQLEEQKEDWNDEASVGTLNQYNDETCQQHDHYPERGRYWLEASRSTLLSRRSILEGVLLLIIAWLLWAKQLDQRQQRQQVTSDVSGFFPTFSKKMVTFKHDPDFVPEDGRKFFTNETRQKWLDLVPEGLGWIAVDEPGRYENLPEPIAGFGRPGQAVFTTSVTHQLHCLYGIAEVYSGLISDPALLGDEDKPWHVNHCFDYLRQSIMCAGDLAIEGQEKTFPGEVTGSDGWDGKHVCKNYDEVYDFLYEHRALDRHWI